METLKIITLSILTSLLLLNSCDLEMRSENSRTGKMILILDQNYNNRTLTPDTNMNVSYYRISGMGPNNATFSTETTESTILQQGLALGEWAILVEGLNTENEIIVNGSTGIEISLDQTTVAEITVSLLTGLGSLQFNVNWPTEDIVDPSIESELISTAGISTSLTASSFITSSGTANFNINNLVTGYYTLSIRLLDGEQLVIGCVEMVWIVNDTVTRGSFNF